MHGLLSKFLQKRGIKDVSELDADERGTFEEWRRILSESDVTVDSIKEFCEYQLAQITQQLKNLDNEPRKNERLILLLNVYTAIRDAIVKPAPERESLEQYLNNLLSTEKA